MAMVSRAAIARAAATSCTMMALGDCLTQEVGRRRHAQQQQLQQLAKPAGSKSGGRTSKNDAPVLTPPPHDWARTSRFALIGACLHGPFFAVGLGWLDTLYKGKATPMLVAKKVLTGQLALFPVYTASFLALLRILEGTPVNELPARLQRERGQLAETIARGSFFWPLVNVVNFSVVPQGNARIAAMNMAGLFWNGYLSYTTQDKGSEAQGGGARRTPA